MKPEELVAACKKLYGDWGYQTKLAQDLGVDSSSVRRWVSGTVPVPGPVAAAIRCFLERKAKY